MGQSTRPELRLGEQVSPAVRRLLRGLQVLLVLLTAVAAGSRLPEVRDRPHLPWLDDWVHVGVYVVAAVLVLLRPVLIHRARLFWSLFSLGMICLAVGFGLFSFHVGHLDPIPFPSMATAGWVAALVFFALALGVLAASTSLRPTLATALDATTGALVVLAAAVAFMYGPLRRAAGGTQTEIVAAHLLYPSLDAAIGVLLIAVLAGAGWRLSGPLRWIAAGLVGQAVSHALFLHQIVSGTFEPLVSPVSAVSVAVLAGAAWVPPAIERRRMHTPESGPGVALPLAFGVGSWVLLIYAALVEVPGAAIALTAVAVAVALVRTGWSFTQSRSLAEQRRLARTDELTGLANRRALLEALEDHTHQASRGNLGVLALDIDDFGALNDAVGHDNADAVLDVVARRIRESTRSIDVVARVGSDDFVVLLPRIDAREAAEAAERIRTSVRRPIEIAGGPRSLSASVGFALAPDDGSYPDDLMRKAELALVDAQTNRLGQRRYDPDRHRTEDDRRRQVERLQAGIRNGELVLHYQPVVDLEAGGVVGVEALVRWAHPERGLLAPAEFLPLAESAGLMRELFDEVLHQATRQTAAWHARGHELALALNVSVTDLLDPDLPDQVADALAAHALRGTHLVLELTEEVFLAEPSRAAEALARLWDHEIGLTIDDYGTGYSSLSYLRDLESLQGLKLDRGFVAGLDGDPRAQAIVASTIELAFALDLEVVAEGIETAAVHGHLRTLGCPLGQGYLFSRPVPADQVPLDAVFPAPAGE